MAVISQIENREDRQLVLQGRALEWLADYFALASDGGVETATLTKGALKSLRSSRSRLPLVDRCHVVEYHGSAAYRALSESDLDDLAALMWQPRLHEYFLTLFRDRCLDLNPARVAPPMGHFDYKTSNGRKTLQCVLEICYTPP